MENVWKTVGEFVSWSANWRTYLCFFFRLAGTDANGFPLREEFAKSCFETLLQFSFVNGTAEVDQRVEQPGGLSLFGVESSTHTSVVITIQWNPRNFNQSLLAKISSCLGCLSRPQDDNTVSQFSFLFFRRQSVWVSVRRSSQAM